MSHKNSPRKQAYRLSTPVRLGVVAVAACFISGSVLSNPLNPTVINGLASFNQAGKVLTVTNSPGAIINWQKFSIQTGETTHFAQTSASSTVLNRVLNDPTAIYGTLSSNGRVWLVNPAGIMVGPGGKVDVAGFVASTLNISNADFLAGRSVFVNDGSAGNVINQGEIRTPAGGSVYLIGSNVVNEGIIVTPKGETILAAGATISLVDSATPGVKVDITGAEGSATNLGSITAEAGRIGIAGVIVRNSGQINASSVVSEGGRVFLKASQDAYVDGNGRIVTTGTKGGSVEVLGNRVAVTGNAEIDASGSNGGGRIMVGGDYQGANPDIQNANITYFGPDASLKANATEVGDGGTVIVWADDTTRAYGSISARGGAAGGNGGLVETSGKRYLDTPGIRVDVGAANGKGGTWLLDPATVNIVASGTTTIPYGGVEFGYGGNVGFLVDDDLNAALSGGANVIVRTDGAGTGNGNISADNVTITGTGSLTLAAYGGGAAIGNIDIYGGSTIMLDGFFKALAGWNGATTYNGSDVISGKGNITISGSQIHSNQNIDLHAGKDITLGQLGGSGSVGTWIQSNGLMSVSGKNLSLYGGQTGIFDISGGQGPGVMLRSDTGQLIVIDNQILLQAGSANHTTAYGGWMYGGSVSIVAGGNQDISAKFIKVHAGVSGHDNSAEIQADGNQLITITGSGGLLEVKGGGDSNGSVYGGAGSFNNQARIQHGQYGGFGTGDQSITVYGGGTVAVYGGSGTGALGYYGSECATVTGNPELCRGSNNNAEIQNRVGQQTLDFASGGYLHVEGGGAGDQNWAGIENDGGDQIIAGLPDIMLKGGTGGRIFAFDANNVFDFVNDAGIYNEGTGSQVIYGGSITINGGGDGTSYGGAGIGNESNLGVTYIGATGNLTMQGGASNEYGGFYMPGDATAAYINSESGTSKITIEVVGTINLTGGANYGGAVLIGTVDGGLTNTIKITAGGTVNVASGANSAVFIGNVADAFLGGSDVTLHSGGDLTVTGTANAPVMIGSLNGGSNPTKVKLGSKRNVTLSKVNVGSPDASSIAVYAGYDGVAPSGYGGDVTMTGPVLLNTTTGTSSVDVVAYESSGGANGSISLGAGTSVYGNSITVVAGGDNQVDGSLFASGHIQLESGWNHSTTMPSSRGGNLTLGGTSILDMNSGEFNAQAGTNASYGGGSLFQNGSVTANGLIGMYADRDIAIDGSVTSNNDDIYLRAGYSETRQFGGNITVSGALSGYRGVTLIAEAASALNGKITQSGSSVITADFGNVRIIGGGNVALSGSIDGGEGCCSPGVTVKAGYSDYDSAVSPYGGTVTLEGTVLAHHAFFASGDGIVLGAAGSISSDASGDAISLVSSGTFTNNYGGTPGTQLDTPNGRWLVYAADPASVTKNGMTSAFRQYEAVYGDPIDFPSGNGFIYASAVGTLQVDTTSTGPNSHIYGGAPTATFGYLIAPASVLAADDEDLTTIDGSAVVFTPTTTDLANSSVGTYDVKYASGLTSTAGYSFVYGGMVSYAVNPATLTILASLTGTTTKVYNGTNIASLTSGNFLLTGWVSTDSATVTKATGIYDPGKNVGTGLSVSTTLASTDFVAGSGTNLANYVLPTSAQGNIGTITKAPISAVTGIAGVSRVYDATINAALNYGGAVGFTGIYGGDVLTVATASGAFVDKNVGTGKTVNISGITLGGTDAGNYDLTTPTATTTANIAKATISAVTNITAASKVYNRNTSAALNTASAAFTGMYGGDALTVAGASGAFVDKNVGTGKTVNISGITLSGGDAGNYLLASNTATALADITPATISAVTGITAASKVYDATANATLNYGGAVGFTGMYGGDVLTVATASGAFLNKNAGTGKTVNISGITLGGADAGNYNLTTPTAIANANISKATISAVTGITVANKVYDGNTTAALNYGGAVGFTGIYGGDALTVASASGAFQSKNVGAYDVNISGITLGGTDAGNYNLATPTATAPTANITQLPSVTWTGGATGNWSNPANWGGALPDLQNVANVEIPSGKVVTFDSAVGTTTLTSINNFGGLVGGLIMASGNLGVNSSLKAETYQQTGGNLTGTGSFTVSDAFNQTGGTIVLTGAQPVSITTSGNATVASLSNVGGSVTITANNRILRAASNADGVNIFADSVNLTSVYGGPSNGLAISAFTEAASSLSAAVGPLASYGGISIQNFGAQPGTIILTDGASNPVSLSGGPASISFYNSGNLAVGGGTTFSSDNNGDIAITSGGKLDYTSGLDSTSGGILLGAKGILNMYGGLSTAGDLKLSAGTSLNIDSSVEGSYVTLVAPTININDSVVEAYNDAILTGSVIKIDAGEVSATNVLLRGPAFGSGDLILTGGGQVNASGQLEFNLANITADGGFLLASSSSSNITGFISGNITLDNGAYFEAGDDINLSFSGGSSTISLSNGSYLVSDTQQLPGTTYLNFLGRSSGGVLIDGAETTKTTGDSGFFVFDSGNPATTGPGGGLVITYANSVVVDPCASSPDLCKPPTAVDPIIDVVEADPCATAPDSAQCKAQKPGDDKDKDKEKDQFGDEQENGKKDEKSSQKKVAQCGV